MSLVDSVTMIIIQISVHIGLDWNWPTGTELGKKKMCIVHNRVDTKKKFIEKKTGLRFCPRETILNEEVS